jgi:hypothetical protein
MLHQLIRFLPSYSLFISLSASIPYWPVAGETLTNQAVGSSSPPQSPVPASPRIQLASPQPEVSVLPDHPASPQPAIQEPSTELEKSPSPTREARNDVSMNIHSSIFHSIVHH